MISRKGLASADVQKIADAAKMEAEKNDWKVCIAILDDGGHLLHFQRLDGAPLLSISIAIGKARTASYGRQPSKVFEDLIAGGRAAFLTAASNNDGLVMLGGGEPIMVDGTCVGSVGVSGAKSDQDAQVANAGIKALG